MKPLSFKYFLESEEQSGHLSALANDLGIEPEDMEGQPFVGSFFSLGKDAYNLSAYQVVDFKRDSSGKPTHAVIKLMSGGGRKRYKKKGDKMLRVDDSPNDKTYLVSIDKLQDLMTQGLQQMGPPGGEMGPPMAGPDMGLPGGGPMGM